MARGRAIGLGIGAAVLLAALVLAILHLAGTDRPRAASAPATATLRIRLPQAAQAAAVLVNGSRTPVTGETGRAQLVLHLKPGHYRIRVIPSSGYYEPGSATAAAPRAGDAVTVTIPLRPSRRLGVDAVAAVRRQLDDCFAANLPARCPASAALRALFDMTAEPKVVFTQNVEPRLAFDATTLRVTSTTPGRATATAYDDPDWGTGNDKALFSVSYRVAVKDGTLTVTPQDGGVTLYQYLD